MLWRSASERLRASWRAVSLAAAGAALSWYIAHRVLGHAQPFFAPIAAAVALSNSSIQRGRRALQLVGGVLLGIAVGELLSELLGTSTVVLAAIVLITMSAAVATGAGFVGQGMMFVNQAASSAILVVALHKHGTGPERAVDALVGAGVALVLGVLVFPAEPRRLLAKAERAVLEALAHTLTTTADLLRRGADPEPMLAVQTGHQVHRLLGDLARARSSARTIVRVAPRRWPARADVDAETDRTGYLDLLANAVLSLHRAATREPLGDASAKLAREVSSLADVIDRLARAPQPWSSDLLGDVRRASTAAIEQLGSLRAERAEVVASILSAVAADLELVVQSEPVIRNTGKSAS